MNQEQINQLIEIVHYKMPYGKYKGYYLTNIPEEYFIWYKQKGWPEGKLGNYLQLMYDMKANGEVDFLIQLRKKYPKA
jgi:uncharacterized protein (DUF3820 family)